MTGTGPFGRAVHARVRRAAVRFAGTLICIVMEIWALSWRKDDRALEKLDRLIADGDRVAAVFWHGMYFPLFALARGRQVIVLTMESFRGDVIAVICHWFGYTPGVLPAHGDGQTAGLLKSVLADRTPLIAIALDGPLGPYRNVKPGFVVLAGVLRLRILPITVHSHPVLQARNRWDKRETPLPFARITVAVGDPIDVPERIDVEGLARWRQRIAEAMNAL